ncbi:MAG TPA: SRPBCC domain-containing protein, partial [Phototrophicaceae bacterium]|nr:SRPBCC domain-containing protein [Phototrophicaceae bacterium]
INAPVASIWEVLTSTPLTRQWVSYFGIEGGKIVSNWKLGDSVEWKSADGKVIVEGNVTAIEPVKLLRFTVFDTSSERPPVTEKDGITFELDHQQGTTTLTVMQGDFGKMTDGEKYYRASIEVWKKVLPKIKELAEQSARH